MSLTEFTLGTIENSPKALLEMVRSLDRLSIDLHWDTLRIQSLPAAITGVDGEYLVIKSEPYVSNKSVRINRLLLKSSGATKCDRPPDGGVIKLDEGDTLLVTWRYPIGWPL